MSEDINKSLELDENTKKISGSKNSEESSPALVFSIIFYGIAVVLVIGGLVVTYQDSSYDNQIVGGDAYNYIIFAGRGITWMAAAITCSLFALGLQILYLYRKLEDHILN